MGNKRLLVVDDEEVVLLSVRKALRKDAFDIDTVQDAREGLERLSQHDYDLVITDLMMPGIDGLGLLERIRELELSVQTIMITGYPTVKTALKAKRLGAFEYVTKPFTRQELRSVVVRAIRRAEEASSSTAPEPPSGQAGPVYAIPDHSWARHEADGSVRVGLLRAFAQSIGPVAEVRLPAVDEVLEQGRSCMVVRAADGIEHTVYSPFTGRVVSTNERLGEEPALVAREPEQEGWLFRLEPRDLDRETQNLVPVG